MGHPRNRVQPVGFARSPEASRHNYPLRSFREGTILATQMVLSAWSRHPIRTRRFPRSKSCLEPDTVGMFLSAKRSGLVRRTKLQIRDAIQNSREIGAS